MKKPGCLHNNVLIYLFLLLFSGSCVSIVEKAGKALDGSAGENRKIAVYKEGATANMELWEVQNRAGNRSVIFFLNDYPSIKFRGSLPNANGEFFLASFEYLAGSYHGWIEYSMELFGTGILTMDDSSASLTIPNKMEKVQISSGRIKSYDTRITGNEALGRLRDRQERISALAEWMGQLESAPPKPGRDEFENYWKPLLFPEIVSQKKQPKNWKQNGDLWINTGDIQWNRSYTERVFPELLWEIRNTGTMLRDWEEALPWIYIECEWENILELLAEEIVLTK